MSKFEGTDFDNVDQTFDIGAIKGDYDAWKVKWNKGTEWGIVGGKRGNKPKTVVIVVKTTGLKRVTVASIRLSKLNFDFSKKLLMVKTMTRESFTIIPLSPIKEIPTNIDNIIP